MKVQAERIENGKFRLPLIMSDDKKKDVFPNGYAIEDSLKEKFVKALKDVQYSIGRGKKKETTEQRTRRLQEIKSDDDETWRMYVVVEVTSMNIF